MLLAREVLTAYSTYRSIDVGLCRFPLYAKIAASYLRADQTYIGDEIIAKGNQQDNSHGNQRDDSRGNQRDDSQGNPRKCQSVARQMYMLKPWRARP